MDRMIATAWKAFWIGLGAAAVLVSQSVLAPSPSLAPAPSDPRAAPAVAPSPHLSPAALRHRSVEPVLSDSKRNPLPARCAVAADVTRCS